MLSQGGASLGLVQELLLLQSFFIPLLQSLLYSGLLVLDSLKLLLEPRHLGLLLLKRRVVRVILVPHLILQLLIGALELVVVQEQPLEYRSPSIGAVLKKAKCWGDFLKSCAE